MLNSYAVIKRVLRTEKGISLTEKSRKYFFDVDKRANKITVKGAVQDIFKVKVKKVNIQVVPGKPKTLRMIKGRTPEWKKAIVTLQEGQKIDLAQ